VQCALKCMAQWLKGIITSLAFSGTSETLKQTLPTAVEALVSSLTSSVTCWTFCTKTAMTTFLDDRKAQAMHAETWGVTPKRTRLLTRESEKKEVWEVWELVDLELPVEKAV